MHALTLVLFIAPAAMAVTPRAREGLPKSFAQSKLINVFATCGAGRVQCENGCMPIDAVCCNDNSDEYCRNGYYCVPNACCPEGKLCSGSSDGEASCDIGETECNGLCMPLTGTCCGDGLHYCPDFGTCTSDGYCCDVGDDCDDDSSSFPSSSSSSTADDDFTSTTSRTTTATATFTVDPESSSSTSSDTSSDTTSDTSSEETSSSSSTTVDSNTEAPVTPAPTAVVTTTVSQQAGGIFTADGKIAAGLAVVAALLV